MPELNNRPIVKYLDPKTGSYEYATVIDVGDLQLLNTQVKSDLVQAINSLFYDDRISGGGELSPEDLEKLKNIQASIDSIKDGTFEIVNFGSINTYLNQEMNAKYEELVKKLNESNREIYDATLIDIKAAVDAATLAYEQKVAEQNALLDGAEKTLTDTKLALEETAKKLETADINYKSLKQTVDELNNYIETEIKVIDMDNFNSMVSDYKTAVKQTEDRYGVEASKQTLSYLTGQVADAQAQINVQAGEIELRAKTDQLQYIPAKKESNANPNLLFETIELLSSHWDREYGAMVTPNTFRYGKIGEFTSTNSKFTTVSDTLEIGETYTLSLYTNEQPLSKSPTDEKFAPTEDSFTPDDLTVIVDGKTVTMAIFEDLSSINGWCGVSGQFIATKENATITILSSGLEQTTHIGYISQPKLEKGLKVTPFISHVDDEIATVSTAFSLIKSQGDTILLQTQRVSQIGEENDALKETVAGIQIESNKITTAVSELEKKTDGEISRVEGKIETEANRIALDVSNKTTDEKLSALNMDTRNRIVNSDFELSEYVEKTKNWNYHGWSTIVSGIFTVLKLDNTNYLIADKTTTSSNLNNSVWMRSAPFEIQTGKKMNVQAEVFIASNPDNYQVIEIELFDDKNTLLSTVPINVSQYTSNVLRTVNVKNVPYNVFRVNFSAQIKAEGVYKAQLKLGLRSGRGKVGFTKIMLNTSNMSEVDWSPAEEDNRIVQTKLESKIEILEDSITLMSEDERLDVLSGLLVQESGIFKISPQSILQEVTSAELGDSALVTKTFMNQTADGWKQGLVGKDGIIQAINASEEEYLIAFDKVRVDGLLEAKHFMGNALTLTDGFKIADKDGNAVLMANNDGQVVMNVSQLEINARPVATKDDVDERINNIALTPGPQGVSVNGVTEYYLATNASSGVTTSTPGWSTSIPAISATKQYLWNYEVTSFSNGSKSTPTTPVIIGRYGLNGNDGVSITNVVNYYALSNDKNVAPTSEWSTSPLLTSQTNRYLWNYEEIVYSNNTKTTTPKAVIGTHGESGSDGVAGKDGVGIKSTVITYGLSTAETTQPSSWSSAVPTLTKGKYLWNKTEWTYTDGSKEIGYTKAYIAKDGNDGNNGLPGKDGVGIKSTSIHYAKSTSGTSHSGATWLTTVPSVPNGQYLWTRTTWTYDDNTTEVGYSVAKMGDTGPQGPRGLTGAQGPQGDQGIKGADGKDGQPSYTHIAYADTITGTGFSHSDATKPFIGIYTNNNPTSSGTASKYTWSKWKGEDGADGIQGPKGADGLPSYTHFAYANNATGTSGFSTTDSLNKSYLGIYTDNTKADSSDPSKYTWTLIKGATGAQGPQGVQGLQGPQGKQGIQGSTGPSGKSSYTHIAYATGDQGQSFNHSTFEQATHVGMYVSDNQNSSDNWRDYKWTLIRGRDGSQGIQGPKGTDGKTPYFHIAYANNSTGTLGFSINDSANKLYIGTYTDFTSADSTDPTKYKWTLIKGEKGETGERGPQGLQGLQGSKGDQGIQGPKGADGKSSYTHIAYATNATGTSGFSTSDSTNKTYIGMYVDNISTDSTDPAKYKWTLIKGADGAKGLPGAKGADGKTPYFHTAYANSADGTVDFSITDSDKKKYIGTATTYSDTNPTGADPTDPSKYKWVDMVGSVEVGGRNLLKGTTNEWTQIVRPEGDYFWVQGTDVKLEVGETYTFSVIVEKVTNDNVPINLHIGLGRDPNTYVYDVPSWALNNIPFGQKISLTRKIEESHTDNGTRTYFAWRLRNEKRATTIRFKEAKLEKGNIATDWTPAPEDVQSQIDKSIKSTDVEYYLSTSSTSLSGGSWKTTAPQWVNGKYMWSRTKVVLNDGTPQYRPNANGVNISGAKGDTGATGSTGATGTGISSITEEYYLSTSKTTQTGGSWVTTPPKWENGKYIWTRSKIVYTNPSSTKWTDPIVSSEWEAVNELVVGGRNIIRGTSNAKSSPLISTIWNDLTVPLEVGEYSFQFIAKASENIPANVYFNDNSGQDRISVGNYVAIALTTEYKKFTGTIKVVKADGSNDDNIIFRIYRNSSATITIKENSLKVEKGNKPTDWTLAPEDVQANIDNIQVGGRNYFTKSTRMSQLVTGGTFVPRHTNTPNGVYLVGVNGNKSSMRIYDVIKSNGWWTVSFDIKGSQNVPVGFEVDICDLGGGVVRTNTNNTYTRVSVSKEVTNWSSTYNFIDFENITYNYIWVDNIKVEQGNRATDWTPAPEDVQSSIDSKADATETEQALNDATAILQTLQQEVQAAALDGELKDFIARYNEEQKALDTDKKESNKKLQDALSSISSLTNNMDNMSQTWKFVDRFIKNSPKGIVVGNDETGSYILITEDKLSFFSNNEEVAFIAQNLMEISRGAFVEQIQISQYIFEKYGTNQLAIRYAG